MPKARPEPRSLLHKLTYDTLRDPLIRRRVEELLAVDGYELVEVGTAVNGRADHEFMSNNCAWNQVTETSHKEPLKLNSFIVIRPTEKTRMGWFFFGRPRGEKGDEKADRDRHAGDGNVGG